MDCCVSRNVETQVVSVLLTIKRMRQTREAGPHIQVYICIYCISNAMKGSQLERSPLYLLYYLREVSRQTAAEVLFMLELFIVRIQCFENNSDVM